MAAGVTRAELHVTDAHRKNLTFHDLLATGLTWMAVRGDQPLSSKQRAGHRSFSTTEIYIREAESLTHGLGETFPELPDELTGEFRLRLKRRAKSWNAMSAVLKPSHGIARCDGA
jgi:hypothetical protein